MPETNFPLLTTGSYGATTSTWVPGPVVFSGESLSVTFTGEVQVPVGGVDGLNTAAFRFPTNEPFALLCALVPDGAARPDSVTASVLMGPKTYLAAEVATVARGGLARLWLTVNTTTNGEFLPQGSYEVQMLRVRPQEEINMSDRFTINQQIQLGVETTPGVAVACPIRLRTVEIHPSIKAEFKRHRTEGSKRANTVVVSKEWTEASIDGLATYTEIGYLLSSLVSKPKTSGLGSGVFQHVFASSDTVADDLQSYTVQFGRGNACEQMSFGMVQSLTFKSTRDDVHMSGTLYGRALKDSVNDSVAMTPGSNEVQSVSINGSPTGGNFTLGFKGATTGPIAFNATATAIQTAVLGLPTIGAGNVAVALSGGVFTVTFGGALAGYRQPLLEANYLGLTGGTNPTVTVVSTTRGGFTELWKLPIMPGDLKIFLANTYGDLGLNSAKLARAFSTDWSLGERTKPFWVQDADTTGFAGYSEGEPKEMLDLLLEADAVGMGLRQAYREGATRFIRLSMVSANYKVGSSSTSHSLVLDAAVKVAGLKEFKDEQGLYAIGFELQMVDCVELGAPYRLTLVNGVESY